MSFYTYMHTRNDTNEVFYIGKGTGDRMYWKYGRNRHWTNIVQKHGFTPHVLAYWNNEEECFAHEKFIISCMKDMGIKLVNLSDGGDGPSGRKVTDEQRKKMSDAAKRKYKNGFVHPKPMLGTKASEKTKQKMREAHAKRDCSMPIETRQKVSASSLGKKGTLGMLNKKHSNETKKKISDAMKSRSWSEARRMAQKKG